MPDAACHLCPVRMYLSSFRVGNCPHRLIELARGGTRAAVIANAMDAAPSEIRTDGVKRELNALTALGLVAEELDLRDHFGTRGAVVSELRVRHRVAARWQRPPIRSARREIGSYASLCHTEMWLPQSLVNGSLFQPPHRSWSRIPARRAMRSSSEGHTNRNGAEKRLVSPSRNQ